MSRSYKKSPVYTDGSRGTTKDTKRKANQKVRRRNKRIVKGYLMRDPRYRDEKTLDGKFYKRFFCSWDIHDYISYWTVDDAIQSHHRWKRIYEEYKDEQDFLNKHYKKYYHRK